MSSKKKIPLAHSPRPPIKRNFGINKFYRSLERTNHWSLSPSPAKCFLYLVPVKTIFQAKKNFTLALKKHFSTWRKSFLYLPDKIINFLLKKRNSYNYKKKSFSNRKLLVLAQKGYSVSRCVLNTGMPYFVLENISHLLFVEHFKFQTLFF